MIRFYFYLILKLEFCVMFDFFFQMQRAEMEELRQREANLTALLAIGTRKKPKLEDGSTNSGSGLGSSSTNAGVIFFLLFLI